MCMQKENGHLKHPSSCPPQVCIFHSKKRERVRADKKTCVGNWKPWEQHVCIVLLASAAEIPQSPRWPFAACSTFVVPLNAELTWFRSMHALATWGGAAAARVLPGYRLLAGEVPAFMNDLLTFASMVLSRLGGFRWVSVARPGSLCPPVADRGCSRRLYPRASVPSRAGVGSDFAFCLKQFCGDCIRYLGLLLGVSASVSPHRLTIASDCRCGFELCQLEQPRENECMIHFLDMTYAQILMKGTPLPVLLSLSLAGKIIHSSGSFHGESWSTHSLLMIRVSTPK